MLLTSLLCWSLNILSVHNFVSCRKFILRCFFSSFLSLRTPAWHSLTHTKLIVYPHLCAFKMLLNLYYRVTTSAQIFFQILNTTMSVFFYYLFLFWFSHPHAFWLTTRSSNFSHFMPSKYTLPSLLIHYISHK